MTTDFKVIVSYIGAAILALSAPESAATLNGLFTTLHLPDYGSQVVGICTALVWLYGAITSHVANAGAAVNAQQTATLSIYQATAAHNSAIEAKTIANNNATTN